MIQNLINETWDSAYSKGHRNGHINGVLEAVEVIKSELHKYVMQNKIIYVDDVVNLLDRVRENVLCQETDSSQSCSANS